MPTFKFIHAADLHLDSPLTGLASRSEGYARRIDDASRAAFSRLIQLAIDEECAFVLIAGDLFDGQWRDYRTGLFFASHMGLLREAGILVYIILGNHDAENRFVSRLQLTDNVTVLSSKAPQTVKIESLNVAIHGQSFPTRDVTDNLAARYPSPIDSYLNIGMLHTALDGREGHADYAPCNVDQLKNHGYHYWALGHVHKFGPQEDSNKAVVPYIVYSGVLQGRHIREPGAKGAVLVTVEDDEIVSVEHKALDSVRWASASVDIADAPDTDAVVAAALRSIETELSGAEDRALAIRVSITGTTPLHGELAASRAEMRELIETAAAGISADIWIEKLLLDTVDSSQTSSASTLDPSIAGKIKAHIEERSAEPQFILHIAQLVDEIKMRMPPGALDDQVRQSIITDAAASAPDIAKAVLDSGME